MKMKKIVSGILCVALLGAAGTSFVSCDDREADIRTELKGEMGAVQDFIKELETQLGQLDDKLAELEQCACDPNLGDRVTNLQTQIDEYNEWKETIEDLIENFQSGVSEERVLQLLAEYAKKADYVSKRDLEDILKKYYTADDVDEKFATKAELTAAVAALEEEDSKIWAALDNYLLIDSLEQEVLRILEDGHYATWDWVEEYVRGYTEGVIVPFITDLLEEHTKELLQNMVTSIEINGTENPIFGGAALPADVRTTVLAAYHGVAPADIEFPKNWRELNIGTTITPFEAGVGEVLINKEEGNAGTLYLTINPSSVDFNGKEVALVTSQNNEAPITLSPLTNSEKELMFGFTRTKDNPNGFYEAKATLKEEDIENARMKIDFNNLKSSVKDVLNQRSKSSIAKLAANLFSESSDILPAYAVKTTYNTDLTDEDGNLIVANVLSQYSIAATTVKPLSFNFMEGVQYDIPGLERIEKTIGKAIDNVFGQIKKAIPDFSEIGEIGGINFDNVKKTIVVEITADQLKEGIDLPEYVEWEDEFGPHKAKLNVKYGNITVEVPLDEFLGELESGMNLDQLNDALAQLKEISNVGSDLDHMRDKLKNKVFGYIDRINSAFNTLTGSVNAALQPCLLFLDKNGNIAGRVSTSSTLATQVKGEAITLVPTSYTAELFAPAYKKFVAVTAVNGETESVCAEYNKEGLGEVYSGNNWDGLTLNLKAGNTYEITYYALDYSGVERSNKYYISVVK